MMPLMPPFRLPLTIRHYYAATPLLFTP